MTGVTKSPSRRVAHLLVAMAVLGLPLAAALAQEWTSIAGGSAVAGRELVEKNCGNCHSSGYVGLLISGSSLTQADLAARVKDQANLLRALHYQRHPTMPQYLFSDSQMTNILAYFARLREGGMQYPLPTTPDR